jgi:hypothetical protein
MRRKNHIAAFTMMDILTGMVVMSIVVSMVFYLMSATTQQATGYQQIRIELNDYLLLRADLNRKANSAERMEDLPNGFRLSSSSETVNYLMQENFLIRKSENSLDTLSDQLAEIKKTALDSLSQISFSNPLLSSVEIKLKLGEQYLFCHLEKDYGITEPINQKLIREF